MDVNNNAKSSEERCQLRHEYRKAIHDTPVSNEEYVKSVDVRDLSQKVLSADKLYNDVKHTREAALDSQLMVAVSELSKKKIHNLTTNFLTFSPCEFAEKLVAIVAPAVDNRRRHHFSEQNWISIHDMIPGSMLRTPSLAQMYGMFEPTPALATPSKKRKSVADKPTEQQQRDAPVTMPKQLHSSVDSGKSKETAEEVERVMRVLRTTCHKMGHPICFFEFVINKDSFSQTIENIFHVSFLVREGQATITLDGDKLPVIEPTSPHSSSSTNTRLANQFIVSMSMEEWTKIIHTFRIGVCPLAR